MRSALCEHYLMLCGFEKKKIPTKVHLRGVWGVGVLVCTGVCWGLGVWGCVSGCIYWFKLTNNIYIYKKLDFMGEIRMKFNVGPL